MTGQHVEGVSISEEEVDGTREEGSKTWEREKTKLEQPRREARPGCQSASCRELKDMHTCVLIFILTKGWCMRRVGTIGEGRMEEKSTISIVTEEACIR